MAGRGSGRVAMASLAECPISSGKTATNSIGNKTLIAAECTENSGQKSGCCGEPEGVQMGPFGKSIHALSSFGRYPKLPLSDPL